MREIICGHESGMLVGNNKEMRGVFQAHIDDFRWCAWCKSYGLITGHQIPEYVADRLREIPHRGTGWIVMEESDIVL